MIYFNRAFRNYEEFKNLFGIVEHGNGKKSRKNKILLSLFKSRPLLHACASRKEEWTKISRGNGENNAYKWVDRYDATDDYSVLYQDWYDTKSMVILENRVVKAIAYSSMGDYCLRLNDRKFRSNEYKTDDFKGLCQDKDSSSIRYVNIERNRVFKMRAGKFYRKIVDANPDVVRMLPYEVRNWICEVLTENWKSYAQSELQDDYELHVDDNFSDIYDSDHCLGYDEDEDSFGSCMTNGDGYRFYDNAVKAKAAYLTNEDDMIVARCIIYTDVHVCNSNDVLRLAERQYAANCDDSLKRMLIIKLIAGGYIDGYKKIGASCSNSRAFVDCDGNPFDSTDFWISCHLEDGDALNYQDSFKYYNYDRQKAYNDSCHDYDDELTDTCGYYESSVTKVYCEDSGEYERENDAYYCEGRDAYYSYSDSVCSPENRSGYECVDDCVEIGGYMYYAGRDCEYCSEYGISYCEMCGEYFLDDDGFYSEITETTYCCEGCMETAEQEYKERYWHYSEYDEEYYEDERDVITVFKFDGDGYHSMTICVATFNSLVSSGDAIEYCGTPIIDTITDGAPEHYDCILTAA